MREYMILIIGDAQLLAQAMSSRQPKMAEFVDWIEGISVTELGKLVTALEDRLGFDGYSDWLGSGDDILYDSRKAAKALSQGGSWTPDDYGRLLMAKKHGSNGSHRHYAGNNSVGYSRGHPAKPFVG